MQEQLGEVEELVEKKEYKQLFAVYGTLRLNQGNWRWCLEGVSDHLGTIKTEPIFDMFSLGAFPAVAEDGNTAITVDIFGTNDEDCIDNVNSLEGHIMKDHPRNWYNTATIDTPWGPAEMFIMNAVRARNTSKVVTGDWLNREIQEVI